MKQHSFHQPGLAQHTLHIHAQPRPEVMERVLRVVRHRGFALCTLNMEQDCQQLRMRVTVESQRPTQQLSSQLVKPVAGCRVSSLEQQRRTSE